MSYGRRWRFLGEQRWRRPEQEPSCLHAVCLVSTDIGLAVGCDSGRVSIWSNRRWHSEAIARTRRPPEVQSLVLDPDSGNLWATTRHGLFHRLSPGRWHRDAEFPARNVHMLQVWNDNVLALGNNGLFEHAQGEWTPVLVDGDTVSLAMAAAGGDVLAMVERGGNGLVVWRRGELHPSRVAVVLGRVNCMVWDARQLWLGTDQGLLRWRDERLDRFTWGEEGANRVAALATHRDRIYVGSLAGVWQAPASALDGPGRDDVESLGRRAAILDGLPQLQVSSMTVHEDEVWVGTHAGLAVLGSPDE